MSLKQNNELANHIQMLFGDYKLDPTHRLENGSIILNKHDQEYVIQCINKYEQTK